VLRPTVYPRQHVHMLREVAPLKCGCNRIYLINQYKAFSLVTRPATFYKFFTEGAPSYPPPTYWCVFLHLSFFTCEPAGGGRTVLSSYPVFLRVFFLQGGLFPLPPPPIPVFYTCFNTNQFLKKGYWTSSSYK
jgi:hypothetical protein